VSPTVKIFVMMKHGTLRVSLLQLVILSNATVAFAYLGVLRYSNGTDIELRRWNKELKYCGAREEFTQNKLVVFNDTRCGYTCISINSEAYSSYIIAPNDGLTCQSDRSIREGTKLL